LHVTFLCKPAQTRKNDAKILRKIERHNEKQIYARWDACIIADAQASKTGVKLPVLDEYIALFRYYLY